MFVLFLISGIGLLLVIAARFVLFDGESVTLKTSGKRPDISIVIPARNEEQNLPTLLQSLSGQTLPPIEILVVDDGSTDDTAEVARNFGAKVLELSPLETGWRGKPFALQTGAGKTSGSHLLFVDADVELLPDCLEKLAAFTDDYDAVSVCPFHKIKRPYEQLSAFFNLLMVGGVGALSSFRGENRRTLFGQMLLVRRTHFEAVGGYEPVKDKVLENVFLAQHLRQKGSRCLALPGKGLVEMRMFPDGFQQLVESWTKGFTTGTEAISKRLFTWSILWITGLFLVALPFLISLPLAVISGRYGQAFPIWNFYLITTALLHADFRKVGNFSYLNALLFPVSLTFHQWVFARAKRRRKQGLTTQWKGRDVA